jgi:hypothetical protein
MRTASTAFAPDPESAVDVLAFVLCPAQVFAPAGGEEELAAVREAMLPVKTAAVKRWSKATSKKTRN